MDPLAIYGAIVGTIALVLSAIKIWLDRAVIKVKTSWGYFARAGVIDENPRLILTTINKGRRLIKLEGAGLRFSNGSDLTYIPDPYTEKWPVELSEKDKKQIFFDVSSLKEDLKKQGSGISIEYAWFRDTTDNIHKCSLSRKTAKYLQG